MNATDVPSFLRNQVSLFRDFSDEQLAELVTDGRVVSVEASEAVAHCGDDARFLGVVLEGELVVSAPGEGGRAEELFRFKAGDTFGELGLMTGDKVQGDFVAVTHAQVLEIPVGLFQAAILSEPSAVQRISKTVTERLKQVMVDPAKSADALNRSADPYGLRLHSDPPQKLLVINCGSSSVKYSFFDTASDASHARGMIERIGTSGTRHVHRGPNGETTRDLATGGYAEAFDALLDALTDPQSGVIRTPAEVSAIGHRVVHGGERFTEATVITDDVLAHLEELSPLAPLHNPVNIAGIREARRVFPNAPHVAVFDTAFHHTLTEQFNLGIFPPVRESGDINSTPGCTIEGTAGSVTIDRGVICALRHIHMTPADALRFGVRNKSFVRVRVEGDRELIFGDVLGHVDPGFALAMHIDTDEANAANLRTGAQGHIEGIQSDPQNS